VSTQVRFRDYDALKEDILMLLVFTRKGIAILLAYLVFITLTSFLLLGVQLVNTFESDAGAQQPTLTEYPITEEEFMHRCIDSRLGGSVGHSRARIMCQEECNSR
jgi:hypothetical protein